MKIFENKKRLLLILISLGILITILSTGPTGPNNNNIFLLTIFLTTSIIYTIKDIPKFHFINQNKYTILFILYSLLYIIIYRKISTKIAIIYTIIVLLVLFIKYLNFLNKNLPLDSSNNFYHNQFFFNLFGFYFWYHLFVILILFSLYFINWNLTKKVIITIFVLLITLFIDYMYYITKPYEYFN